LLFFDSLGRALIKKDQNRDELGFGSKRIRNEPSRTKCASILNSDKDENNPTIAKETATDQSDVLYH
jgi:hypothetical protein